MRSPSSHYADKYGLINLEGTAVHDTTNTNGHNKTIPVLPSGTTQLGLTRSTRTVSKAKKRAASPSSSSSSDRPNKKAEVDYKSEQCKGNRSSVSKSPDHSISHSHNTLDEKCVPEADLFLAADICAGQSKNATVLWYLLWRTLTGRSKRITLSFLTPCHT